MKFLPKIKKFFINTAIVVVVTFVLFEVLYRYSVIDFYKAETAHLNTETDLANTSVDFLVFGDSFSATAKEINYIDKLREKNPKASFVNVSVPGIGVRQVNTFAKAKIKKHQPKAIIYQIYVGNDLVDVNHLWSWEKFSVARNLYWEASDHFLSLSYLNHKATVFSPRVNSRTHTMATDDFSIDFYDERTKRFLNFDRSFFNNTLLLKEPFKARYDVWLGYMQTFLETIPKDIPVYLVWIPHCSQVNDYYLNNLNQLGATFDDKTTVQQLNYPFFAQAKKDLKAFTNVTQLNPLETFQANDTENYRLYFANDPHINDNGNVVLRDFLQTEISF
ncbi:hypothetical protein IMCC3317_34910 [Kordia antarctica]|uniref:SGNH/GDSL hydrolase family protein n=1 Tax=Kordia antarctica TaxID=1218801 RepID=A0A7L4ZNB6_9FLAO|nr:hypothetical protein [Kordia antarctica]QHI38105.1 hypothetical protein IMCC3317_34910 [Kordia antarctica]